MHIAFLIKFPVLKNIVDMARYHASIFFEKQSHLMLRQPNSIPIKLNIKTDFPISRLKYHDIAQSQSLLLSS